MTKQSLVVLVLALSLTPLNADISWADQTETVVPAPAQNTEQAASPETVEAVTPTLEATSKPQVGSVNKSEPTKEPVAKVSSTRPAATKPKMLYGRIEELTNEQGATLPLKMKAMQPQRDVRLDGKATNNALSGQANANARSSYPIDFRGTWSGELTIFSANFSPVRWEFDRAETEKEVRLMKPGTKGQCTVNFYQGNNNSIQLEPCEVIFYATTNSGEMNNQMKQLFGNSSLGSFVGRSAMNIPYMYALHLGNLTAGVGVTGNQLNSRILKNQLNQLATGVLEQVVVAHASDRNPTTGKTRLSYSESVLRFTRIDANRLYLQAASVNYRNDGRYEDKVILYGTLNRFSGAGGSSGYGTRAAPSLFNGGNNGNSGGSGGFQQIEQMMRQIQNMTGQ
ncbi:MAG: hypothetical protein K2W82_05285 [Candidatus Obscuribacterales bacterium]|nr:hypothetical protein [Candidatus Obscuribacterales bacterium]